MNPLQASPSNLLDASEPVYRQIADRVRDKILNGQMESGMKLPNTEEMANLWKTNIRTMHLALSQLVKEGLLTRVPRRGTFVRPRREDLTHVGIYVTQEMSMSLVCRFYQELILKLAERMGRFDIRHSLWVDIRSESELRENWEALNLAVRRQEIQGLISISSNDSNRRWMTELSIPVAHLGEGDFPSMVSLDRRQLFALSFQRLKDQGCRSVGVIGDLRHKLKYLEIAKELGMTIEEPWIRTPSSFIEPNLRELWGYEQFLDLWNLESRPDGLAVLEDVMCRGVITGALSRQVEVPGELKLVLHRNAEVPLLCPFSASFVESSCAEVAEALLQQLQRTFRKERSKPVLVPYRHARN
jgi:DNA-binding transcriptional regulator YhcF (GntR family)